MVCSTDDLVLWRDFPKGLRVLLLGEEGPSAAETKLMLEAVDYVVSPFYNEKDALEAISNNDEIYHVAIVEVTIGNSHGSFRFLEMATDLPTVVISNIRCLSTMMKCIALGAAEFVQKPLSEDKLRNIWQHVVHKASNAGGNVLSKPLRPIQATVVSMFQLQSETAEVKIEVPSEVTNAENDQENDRENTVTSDRFSAPSTPRLKQGVRLLDDGDCQGQPHFSTEKEGTKSTKDLFELRRYTCSESQSVDIPCKNLVGVINKQVVSSHRAEEEVDSADGSKAHECSTLKEGSLPSSHIQNGGHLESRVEDLKKKNSTFSINSRSHGNRGNKKRMKVDWTPALHRQFVEAVEQLGIDQAIPSKILELMKVDGLTRHNVASHLQKFRMHRRHILPKDDDMRCHSHANTMPTGHMWKPLVALPAVSSNYVYPVWGNQSYLPSGIQMWGHTGFSWWQPPPNSWPWKMYPGIHADAWGCPVIPPYSQCIISSQAPPVSIGLDAIQDRNSGSKGCYDFDRQAAEEVIDKVVKEAMSKPWLPLPLGLKPPSTDSVLAELHRLGIRTIPPRHLLPTGDWRH